MVYTLYKPSFWGYLKGNFLYRVNFFYTKAPHLLFPQFMEDDDKEQRNLGLFFGMVFMSKCLEMWVFGKNITKGMSVEIEKAKQRGLKLRYFTDRCEEVPENERT